MAGTGVLEQPPPAASFDHLRNQPATSCAARRDRDRGRCSLSSRFAGWENHERHVRMGHLAFRARTAVNGVSALHTDLHAAARCFRDLHSLIPTVSSTRPTASRSGAGCSRPIQVSRVSSSEAVGPRVLVRRATPSKRSPRWRSDAWVRERFARRAPGEQGQTGATGGRSARSVSHRPRCAVRRPYQTHTRVQAAAAQHRRDRRATSRRCATIRREGRVPRQDPLRGRRRLPDIDRPSSSSSSSTTSRK